MWRWGTKFPRAQRRLAVSILGTTALIALALFLLNRCYACILAFGRQNCLFEGLACLSLFLLSMLLARGCIVLRGENRGREYIFMLLMCSAWAGMGLAQNLCLFPVFLNMFVFAADRWLKTKGLTWRFLALRDDYRDDANS